MKLSDAKSYIEETMDERGLFDVYELSELILWAYDKGWSEGIEDYREEHDSTEENVWRITR